MAHIDPSDWRPIGIDDLEPSAWKALRCAGSTLVVAGPGAGKTEFLAQRAAYLLQTQLCAPPQKVLAISFKRDAADNLAKRVRARCSPEQADRFSSMTFDSFTKGLVDRFTAALPPRWRVPRSYNVLLPTRNQMDAFLDAVRLDAPNEWQPDVGGLRASDFESKIVGSRRLQAEPAAPVNGVEFALDRWWTERLAGPTATPTFVCLNRLAELLLRTNPQILRALRSTYPFVFVDEFQDTTHAQYDFLASAFAGTTTRLTVVGDEKQRIMAWAGARTDSLTQFETDFDAHRMSLALNFRSSPDLVRVQQVVARAIDAGSVDVEARTHSAIDGDVAQIWTFETADREAEVLADWLRRDLDARGTVPRDYGILVRQHAHLFEAELSQPLANRGIRLRNESKVLGKTTLQDLLAEEATQIALALLSLGANRQSADAWATASVALVRLRSEGRADESFMLSAQEELAGFVRLLRREMLGVPTSETATALGDAVFKFLDRDAFPRSYPEYATGDLLDIVIEAFVLYLSEVADAATSWPDCLREFLGADSVPLMTVHKSKGLEYDTVLFLGLDDQQWWAHSAGNLEGVSTFFVALSRARQRAIFTYCRARGARTKVSDLYALLRVAGVPEIIQ